MKLASVVHGAADEKLLDSYPDERHAAAQENLAITGATMSFLVPQTEGELTRRLEILERSLHDVAARSEVDSGRLAEPFWYTDSLLTTPDPKRPFAGRPPKGEVPAPAPGVIVADSPVTIPASGEASRLRLLAREKFMVLVGDTADEGALAERLSPWEQDVVVCRVSDLGADVAERIGLATTKCGLFDRMRTWRLRCRRHRQSRSTLRSLGSSRMGPRRQGNRDVANLCTVLHSFGGGPRCAPEDTATTR